MNKNPNELTAKQSEIFMFLKEYMNKKGYPPSVREICVAVKLKSTSTVHAHLLALKKKGYIKSEESKPRTLEILKENITADKPSTNDNTIKVPIIGNVAAGEPILAQENIESYFPFPQEMLPNTEIFMLKVQGDSMINIGIYDGDYITVAKQDVAENGDIVVALINDGATVKKYYKEDNHIRLQPENDNMEAIIIDECTILGKVIGLLRMYK